MNKRICKLCGEEFIPKSSRQFYCKKEIIKKCPVCGDDFIIHCHLDNPITCSKEECKKKAAYIGSISKVRKCKICGSEFKPTSSTQQYCNNPITRVCKVCGKEFTIRCTAEEYKKQTCSLECQNKIASEHRQLSYMKQTKICELCGREFHPRSNTQKVCEEPHYRKCVICGKEFELQYKSTIGQVDLRITCSEECQRKRLSENNAFKRPEVREKIKATMLDKYGVEHPTQNPEIRKKMYATYKDNYGYDHPAHNPNTLSGKNLQISSLEQRFKTVLENNQIDYEQQKQISKDSIHHKFDFYLPKYKMYVDIDGMYYHGYLDDSNGYQIDEDRDNARLTLVEQDEMYVVIPEIGMNSAIDEFLEDIRKLDGDLFDYSTNMFNWCRSIDFPYPVYDDNRLKRDYKHLCSYDSEKYVYQAKLGLSSIRHFHRSIYDAKVGNNPSIKEAWNDDEILRRVIHNRMIYKNDVDPSKVLAGFYISKIVPRVSIFNPVLARYLTLNYLDGYNIVTDPFSGFSGRLLGVTSTGKQYCGFDLNPNAVQESQEIINFHELNAEVSVQDILDVEDRTACECILTCPPYFTKEVYNEEVEFKSCDEWIDIVLEKYSADKYVFVVDNVEKYKAYIVEDLLTKSYLTDVTEHIVVIDKDGGN